MIGTAVCGKPHVRWCERAGEIKTSPLYSIFERFSVNACFVCCAKEIRILEMAEMVEHGIFPAAFLYVPRMVTVHSV